MVRQYTKKQLRNSVDWHQSEIKRWKKNKQLMKKKANKAKSKRSKAGYIESVQNSHQTIASHKKFLRELLKKHPEFWDDVDENLLQ